MSSKRALVVDDSKSARAFLSRILERHEITVDAAESAEAAIEYLARNKPDVIFMDHMMPGMDGFQAVQTIKNNPRTSTIPILMYTSQEGDLYLGQARALGAEGVLPKQIKQSDVTKLLFQLRLVADRRIEDQSTFTRMAHDRLAGADLAPANESAIVLPVEAPVAPAPDATPSPGPDIASLLPQMSLEIRAALEGAMQKELAALRGFISASLDSQHERIQGDLATALPPAPRTPEIDAPTLVPERRSRAAIAGWSLALLAIAGAAGISWMWWQQGAEIAALRTDLLAAYAEVETLRARPEVVRLVPAEAPFEAAGAETPVVVVPPADAAAAAAEPTPQATAVESSTEPALSAASSAGLAQEAAPPPAPVQ